MSVSLRAAHWSIKELVVFSDVFVSMILQVNQYISADTNGFCFSVSEDLTKHFFSQMYLHFSIIYYMSSVYHKYFFNMGPCQPVSSELDLWILSPFQAAGCIVSPFGSRYVL